MRSFPGGVHPPDAKTLSGDAPIEAPPAPAQVRVPLLQHTGAACESVVKVRQQVMLGELIGRSEAPVSAPVHATVNGKVLKETVATLPNGRHVAVLPIQAEGEQLEGPAAVEEILGGEWPTDGLDAREPEAIAEAARAAGLVGLGGAAFPTHFKLRPPAGTRIDTLVVNGCECEPYLTTDQRLMEEAPAPVVAGAMLAARAVGAARVLVGIEDNKPVALAAMRAAADGTGVEIRGIPTKYPQGAEKQLILTLLGRRVPGGGLPLHVGVVVVNVGTAAALARAVLRGGALTHRVVTVTGAGIESPKNLLVPLGTRYADLIEMAGGLAPDAARVVAGGPMMGFAVGDLTTPVTKGTTGVTVLTAADLARERETACVRCGRCVDVCPMGLVPTRLALAVRAGAWDATRRYSIHACMECGCCAWECPARIPLVQLIRVGKAHRNAA